MLLLQSQHVGDRVAPDAKGEHVAAARELRAHVDPPVRRVQPRVRLLLLARTPRRTRASRAPLLLRLRRRSHSLPDALAKVLHSRCRRKQVER